MSLNKKEEVLLLKNPRFVYLLNNASNNSYKEPVSINKSLISIEEKKIEMNFNSKYEKKNKSHIKINNDGENKKNKAKFKKKSRSKIAFDKEDLLIVTGNDKRFNDESLEGSLIRSSKNARNKKKSKGKNNLHEDLGNVNNLNDNSLLVKDIVIDSPIRIQDLAIKLNIPEAEIITWLFLKGVSVTINQFVDVSIATEVANNYSFNVVMNLNEIPLNNLNTSIQDSINKTDDSKKRPPIITIFGHIDHGKTTLIDAIRSSNMVDTEAGGITQSIQFYEVIWLYQAKQEKLVFLDTPGHEAFTSMRSRGAQITDIAILVVAADDGLKPQTLEVIKYIKTNNLNCIVAINKIDKSDININKVKEELAEHDLVSEDWGGSVPIIELSALKKQNIDVLLNQICHISSLKKFKASHSAVAEGIILESYLDRTRGPIANVLIQKGIVRVANILVSDTVYGKIKALINFNLEKVKSAKPSSIVQVWGFSSVPEAGSKFRVVKNEKEAKNIVDQYLSIQRDKNLFKLLNSRVTFDLNNINNLSIKQVNLIIKADTQGSIEAIIYALLQIPQNKIQLNILAASSGVISDTDIDLAATSNSILLGFNTSVSLHLLNLIKKMSVVFHDSTIIYDLLDFVSNYMLTLVEPEYDQVLIGNATVQTVFEINRGVVAGCLVNDGKVKKNSFISVYRLNQIVYEGVLDSLKRMKDDVEEVLQDNECGVMSNNYNLWQKDDIIKIYQMNEKPKSL